MKTFMLILFMIGSVLTYGQTPIPIPAFTLNNNSSQSRPANLNPCIKSEIYIKFNYSGGSLSSSFKVGYIVNGTNTVIQTFTGVSSGQYKDTIAVNSNMVTLYAQCNGCSSSNIYKINNIEIIVMCLTSLPIELISFKGINNNGINILTWETASETNNDYFTIEHSTNGYSWEEIDKILGAGNSNSIISYSTEHRNYLNSINYYRLTQTDYDGKSEIFPIVSIENLNAQKLIKRINTLGAEVDENSRGMVIEIYSDHTITKKFHY